MKEFSVISLRNLVTSTTLAVGLAIGVPTSASAAQITFGSDLTTVPTQNSTMPASLVNTGGTAGALSTGYTVPTDGVITGWRIRSAGPGSPLLRFLVVRGNTNVYLGPEVNIGPTDSISPTISESVPVKQGDKIGFTYDQAGTSRNIGGMGGTAEVWSPPLAANETRAPIFAGAGSAPIQADLRTDPQTTVTSVVRTKRRVTITTTSDIPGSTFQCTLGRKPIACTGNDVLKRKRLGSRGKKFTIAAVSPSGVVDPTPASLKARPKH